MPFVNEKLLRFVLVLAGIGTLLGFAWKMYDFVQNRDEITRALDISKLEEGIDPVDGTTLGTHLKRYEQYKVLQDLNITGYVAPPPEIENPTEAVVTAILAAEDVEVPMIQSPNAAWVQGRGETAKGDKFAGAFRVIGETFELPNKVGLKLRLKTVQPGWIEIEAIESGEVVTVYALTYEVDAAHVFAGTERAEGAGGDAGSGEGPVFVNPTVTRETEPYSYAVGKDDVKALESMSQEEVLSSLPHRVHRDAMSNEIDGLRIVSVPPNSIFERLGLRADDIVMEVNGQPATDRDQLYESMRKLDTNTLKVRIMRLGGVRTLTFRLPN
jgi:hypothetical protein